MSDSDTFRSLFGGPFGDPLTHLANATAARRSRTEEILADRALRETCQRDGHQYQVHGKANPTKVACKRCHVTWAIGPRTEPTQ